MAAYTAGFMTHVTCRLTAKNRNQLRNPALGNRVGATFSMVPRAARTSVRCERYLEQGEPAVAQCERAVVVDVGRQLHDVAAHVAATMNAQLDRDWTSAHAHQPWPALAQTTDRPLPHNQGCI